VRAYHPSDWTQELARRALRGERRLDLALEGYRFVDLVRLGIAEQTLNDHSTVERTRREFLRVARFTAGRDEYLPIPQQQIDFSRELYQQKPRY
jgi:starch-binding outer membrane protein, SusD/RagB family